MSEATPSGENAGWPSCSIPPVFPARGYESSAKTEIQPRFEDVTQDGRVQLTALMPGLDAVWRALDASVELGSFRERGVIPILRRIVVMGEPGPFSAYAPLACEGTWRLARERGGDRIFLSMWLDVHAPQGGPLAPPPPDAERALVGRVYAEHVVTRPFAPPGERKVTRLEAPGLPPVPEDEHPFEEAESLLEGHALSPAGEQLFAMMHTDSNQHVNSLAYPQVFEEAAVRAAAERRVPSAATLLSRAVELRYRKPFFAGDRAALTLRVEPSPGPHRAVAVGAFAPPGSGQKPSCAVAMWLG